MHSAGHPQAGSSDRILLAAVHPDRKPAAIVATRDVVPVAVIDGSGARTGEEICGGRAVQGIHDELRFAWRSDCHAELPRSAVDISIASRLVDEMSLARAAAARAELHPRGDREGSQTIRRRNLAESHVVVRAIESERAVVLACPPRRTIRQGTGAVVTGRIGDSRAAAFVETVCGDLARRCYRCNLYSKDSEGEVNCQGGDATNCA